MKLKEMRIGSEIDEIVGVVTKSLSKTKSGSYFLKLVLSDSSGTMNATKWDATEEEDREVQEGQPIKINGIASTYKGSLQLTVNGLRPVKATDDYKPEELMQKSTVYTVQELDKEFDTIVQHWLTEVDQEVIKIILDSSPLKKLYRHAPAGVSVHHPCLHGLYAHSISVAKRCFEAVKNEASQIDTSLLILGALLHDIGKAYELDWGVVTTYTTKGKLAGHSYIGAKLVRNACKRTAMPVERADLLEHIILSHHGKLEHGAVSLPQTIEANTVHYCDQLDSKLDRFRIMQEETLLNQQLPAWSERDFTLDNRQLYFTEV